MFGLRLPELLLILAVVLIVFGANKLPQLGAGLGQGMKSFRKAFGGGQDDEPAKPPDSPPQPPAARPPSPPVN
jgi:sec-independent protein translocase protein TatA